MTTDQRVSIFKYGVILIIAVLLFMMWRGCRNEGSGKTVPDTLSVKVDTIWVRSKTDTFYQPAVVKTKYVPIYKTDTLETFEVQKVDTTKILRDYLATRYYQDSISVQYGKVYIDDTVSRNKIVSRGVKTAFNVPVVKETVTISRPPKNIAYLGFEAIGNPQTPLYGVGASLGMKFKNDKYYGLKALMSKEGNPLYGFEFKIPIRLRKR